jgi:hypothetical protein
MFNGPLQSQPANPCNPIFFRRRYDTRIVVSSSPSLLGPWSTPSPPLVPQGSEDAWDYVVTNPSPIILQNGTTLMYYRGTPKYWNSSSAADGVGDELIESVGLAIAPHYLGPYTKPFDAPVLSYMNEDPFAYQVSASERQKRAEYRVVGGRPPEPPPRPASASAWSSICQSRAECRGCPGETTQPQRRRKRAKYRVVGGRPPEPPPRPAS